MENIGISLGWRCGAVESAINILNLRITKKQGYKTCPFDIGVFNYIGVCKCIEDNFRYFTNPSYLTLKKAPKMKEHLGDNQNDDEYFIYNTYYNFVFNHESPGHGNLYKSENWEFGPDHFIKNNFEKFIERYDNRIANFRNYLNSGHHINFVLLRYNDIPCKLETVLKTHYPTLNYNIHVLIKHSSESLNLTRTKNAEGLNNFEKAYLAYMNIQETEYPEEYSRFNKEIDTNVFDTSNSRIILK